MKTKPIAADVDLRVHIRDMLVKQDDKGMTTPNMVKGLQTKFRVGYNRVNAMLHTMASEGEVSLTENKGSNLWRVILHKA